MHHFKLPDNIKHLNTSTIKDNLFKYKYDSRNIKFLIKNNTDVESVKYIASMSSFKGEVFENVIYEHLINFAINEPLITRFIIKGPHQNRSNVFHKNGLLIDKSSQIVYKSAYKDISEFDAMFFTKDSVYIVEMSTSKKTASLNKRLDKKCSLLRILFPELEIRVLVVLTKGSTGLSRFPSFCTIWITDDFEDEKLIKELVFKKSSGKIENNHPKFIEAENVKYRRFKYLQTLEWILLKAHASSKFKIDLRFFTSKMLGLYFDVYTKLYIGQIKIEDFDSLLEHKFDIKKVVVTIEKISSKVYDLVYYVRENNNKLHRVRIEDKNVTIKEKEQEGFTNSEVKYIVYILKDEHYLNLKDIIHLQNNIPKWLGKSE